MEGVHNSIEEMEANKEKDFISSEMKGLKEFTLGTL